MQNPSLAFFNHSRISVVSFVCVGIYMLGFVVQLYGAILPVGVATKLSYVDVHEEFRMVPMAKYYPWSFIDQTIIPRNFTAGKANSGGFSSIRFY
jgi:hypothetical protein